MKDYFLKLKHCFLMIGLFLYGCVHKKRVQSGKNHIYHLLYFVHTLIFCILSYSLYFLKFLTPSQMLNFIFIEFTWKLGYLRRLDFGQEKWLRGHTPCLHAKWLICFRVWWQKFTQKIWVMGKDAPPAPLLPHRSSEQGLKTLCNVYDK